MLNKAFGERFKVRFEPRGELPERRVRADRKRLLQVMTNLLSNAAKFSPEGGVVEISTEDAGAPTCASRCTTAAAASRRRSAAASSAASPRPTRPPRARRAAPAWASRSASA